MAANVYKMIKEDKTRCIGCGASIKEGCTTEWVQCEYCGRWNENPFYEGGQHKERPVPSHERKGNSTLTSRPVYPAVIALVCIALLFFGGKRLSRNFTSKRLYDRAVVSVENGEYSEAIEILKEISPKWNNYDKVERLHDKAMLGVIRDRVNAYFNEGDYLSAIGLIEESVQDTTADKEISDVYFNAVSSYRQQVLSNAESAFKDREFDEALQIVNRGLHELEDDSELLAAKDLYETYRPVNLTSLTPYTSSGFIEVFTDSVKDTMGNLYETGLVGPMDPPGGYWSTGESSLTWDIGGKYDRLVATGIIPDRDKGLHLGGVIKIYGDGVLLYSKYYENTDLKPYPVEIDIADVVDLKIEMYSESSSLGWNNTHTTLVDVFLQKLP